MRSRIAMLSFAASCLLAAGSASAYMVATTPESDSVSVRDCSVDSTQIRCNLVNRSSAELRDVQVAVKHEYRWRNEFHPGEDNPGWSAVLSLRDPIPPGGSVSFTYPGQFGDTRSDGDFRTSVEVLGYTEVTFVPTRVRY